MSDGEDVRHQAGHCGREDAVNKNAGGQQGEIAFPAEAHDPGGLAAEGFGAEGLLVRGDRGMR